LFKEHSPIGHFISERGKEDFYTAYDEAMALLPSPKETKDIETGYGFVRVYLFTKEKNKDKEHVLLLPGRSSSTPMWEPNLEGLMMARPVYTIDLLGEPGMSKQSVPIKNQKDQARWLAKVASRSDLWIRFRKSAPDRGVNRWMDCHEFSQVLS